MFRSESIGYARRLVLAALGAVALTCVGGPRAEAAEELRVWTDDSGQHQTRAVYVGEGNGTVLLRRHDGLLIKVPMARLSGADQAYVKSRAAAKAEKPGPAGKVAAGIGAELRHGLVAVRRPTKRGLVQFAGVVLRKEGDRAYVATTGATAEAVPVIADPGAKPVSATVVGYHLEQGVTILSVPAQGMPEPVSPANAVPLKDAMEVKVFGAASDGQGGILPFRVVDAKAAIARYRVFSSGAVALTLTGAGLEGMEFGLMCDDQGKPVALLSRLEKTRTGEPIEAYAMPLEKLEGLDRPALNYAEVAVKTKSEEALVLEVLAEVYNPVAGGAPPRLLVKVRDAAEAAYLPKPAEACAGPVVPGAAEIELSPRREGGREFLRRYGQGGKNANAVVTGEWKTPIPPSSYCECYLQLVYAGPGGEKQYGDAVVAYCRLPEPPAEAEVAPPRGPTSPVPSGPGGMLPGPGGMARPGPGGPPIVQRPPGPGTRPDGLSMLPPSGFPVMDKLPAFVRRPPSSRFPMHPRGGVLLTPLVMREASAPQPGPQGPFPKPERTNRRLAEHSYRLGDYAAAEIATETTGGSQGARRLYFRTDGVIFAPDGKSLYVLDSDDVLRKIDTATLREELRLKLGAKAADMGLCQEGLMIGLKDANAVRILDADSLEVRREVPIPGVEQVAGSPAGSVGFASKRGSLFVLDLKGGKVLYRLDLDHMKLRMADLFDALGYVRDMRVSADGKYLYIKSNGVCRLRIEGTELVFEERTGDAAEADRESVYFGDDGRRTGFAVSRSDNEVAIFDARFLLLPKKVVPIRKGVRPFNWSSRFVGFDATERVYASTSDGLYIIRSDGERLQTLQARADKVVPHPDGQRFVAVNATHLIWIDSDPERLEKLLGGGTPAGEGPAAAAVVSDPPPSKEVSEEYIHDVPEWLEKQAPQPKAFQADYQGEAQKIGGATFTPLTVDEMYVDQLAFSDDGKAALILGSREVIRVSLTDFHHTRLKLPDMDHIQSAPSWARCKEGWLRIGSVRSRNWSGPTPNVIVVDPDSLRITRAFRVKILNNASALPHASFLLAGGRSQPTALFDLSSGTLTDLVEKETWIERAAGRRPREELQPLRSRAPFRLSLVGDGTIVMDSRKARWRLVNGRLAYAGPERSFDRSRPMPTGDPEYFAIRDQETEYPSQTEGPANAGRFPGLPKHFSIYRILPTKDPSNAVAEVRCDGTSSRLLVMCPAKRRIYLEDVDRIRIFDYKGGPIAEYTLPEAPHGHDDEVEKLAVSPDGGRLLIDTFRNDLFLVTLPE